MQEYSTIWFVTMDNLLAILLFAYIIQLQGFQTATPQLQVWEFHSGKRYLIHFHFLILIFYQFVRLFFGYHLLLSLWGKFSVQAHCSGLGTVRNEKHSIAEGWRSPPPIWLTNVYTCKTFNLQQRSCFEFKLLLTDHFDCWGFKGHKQIFHST